MARKRNRIRLALNTRRPEAASSDAFTGQPGTMPRGRVLQIEVGVLDGDPTQQAPLDDISDFVSVTFELKAQVTDVGALMAQTIGAGQLNPGLKLSDWQGGLDSNAHAVFTFPESGAGGTGLDLGGLTQKDFVFVITALTSVGNMTIGTGIITCVNDGGLTSANTPAAGDPNFVRVDQLNAALAALVKINGDPGTAIAINSKNGKWRRRISVSDTGQQLDDIAKVG